MPFRALGLPVKVLQAIDDAGYTEPTPIQLAAIPPILAGHDLIGIAQTGTGKTAAFTLPMIDEIGRAVQPRRAAGRARWSSRPRENSSCKSKRTFALYARHLPLRLATVFGGVGERPQIKALREGVDLIIATPGRLLDLMGQRAAISPACTISCSTKPIGCWTWVFCPTSDESFGRCRQKRQTLLFSASLFEGNRIAHARIPALTQGRADWPTRESSRDRDAVCL